MENISQQYRPRGITVLSVLLIIWGGAELVWTINLIVGNPLNISSSLSSSSLSFSFEQHLSWLVFAIIKIIAFFTCAIGLRLLRKWALQLAIVGGTYQAVSLVFAAAGGFFRALSARGIEEPGLLLSAMGWMVSCVLIGVIFGPVIWYLNRPKITACFK